MTSPASLVVASYIAILVALALYGIHRWYLLALWWRHARVPPAAPGRLAVLPVVTVQLPLYNERYVARRLLDAVAALDYPRERLEIQVLDDSTDDTTEIVAACVRALRERGIDAVHLRRPHRTGFKAGALDAGLARARGELVAIFDADFVPPPGFLRRLVDHFGDPRVGMVQARWGHLNRDHSALTRAQALLLDGHFVLEHAARHRAGRFFNFNGSAGIWRSAAIRESGGWQHDTLTEDLDLSYRAQAAGWRFVFVPQLVAPAELPVEASAFKRQQHRWAKGSVQTARKLLPAILQSRLAWPIKVEATFHLTANLAYPLLVLLALLVVPAVWLRGRDLPWSLAALDLPIFALASLSVVAFYAVAQREAQGTWRGLGRRIPFLMAVGIGLSINNSRAAIEALLGRPSPFLRTPKYDLRGGERPAARAYRVPAGGDTWIELGLALYFGVAVVAALFSGRAAAAPFLALFAFGFGFMAWSGLRT